MIYRSLIIWLAILIIGASPGLCEEIAYAFGEGNPLPLNHSSVSEYNGPDVITFIVYSVPDGRGPRSESVRPVDSIKQEIDQKVEVGNPTVRDKAARLAARYPGDYTINQICSIYDHMKADWSYVSDPRGIEYFQYANETIQIGQGAGYNGAGDCDDFAILMSALMENIGGTTRIILAYGPNGGHAYTEVYLGKIGTGDCNNVERIIDWLKIEYSIEEIYTHINVSTDEVWLNLDWSGENPGGAFYPANKHVPIYIRDIYHKVPVNPPNAFDVSKMFDPSRGHNGDYIDISIDEYCENEPHLGPTCVEINYTAAQSLGAEWAEIYWLFPESNRGTNPGWKNIFTEATTLTFWARGNNGGERAEFYMGGITGRYSDSVRPAVSTGEVTLSIDWQQYTINLTNLDLSHVIGGFRVVVRAPKNPEGCTIYLDDIRYEWPADK